MTLFDLLEYAKTGVFTIHDGDRATTTGLLAEIDNQWMIWDDLLGEQLEDLALSKLPFTDESSEPEDFDGESHFINEDDGFTQMVEGDDWD